MIKEKPYWARQPQGTTLDRLHRLAAIVERQGEPMTVRAITYKMYPEAHGAQLNQRYNTTCKDAVRARVLGLVPWGSIKEERIKKGGARGYAGIDEYIDYSLDVDDLVRGYSLDKTPAHEREIEAWFEKATVVSEFREMCAPYDVRYISTRGQLPWTTKRKASQRLDGDAVILYFGDNDEKGREIPGVIERDLAYLADEDGGTPPSVEWCGVTDEQERRFNLPPGARLDGLEPDDLREIVEAAIRRYIDTDEYDRIRERERDDREQLRDRLDETLPSPDR